MFASLNIFLSAFLSSRDGIFDKNFVLNFYRDASIYESSQQIISEEEDTSTENEPMSDQETIQTLDETNKEANNKEESKECLISINSKEWLESSRYGNTPAKNSYKSFPINGPLLDNIDSLLLDSQTICHSQSPIRNIKEIDIDNEIHVRMWKIRLMFLVFYHHQHKHLQQEAKQRYDLLSSQNQVCQADLQTYNVGTMDYECKNAKFIVAEMRNVGMGSLIQRDIFNMFIVGLLTRRVVVFYSNINDHQEGFKSNVWQFASCDRRDYQCTFQPLSGCVPTIDEIINAPAKDKNTFGPILESAPGSALKEERIIRFEKPEYRPLRISPVLLQEVNRIANILIDELDSNDERIPILKKAAGEILNDKDDPYEEIGVHGVHSNSDLYNAFLLYFFRTTFDKSQLLESYLQKDLPADYQSFASFGFPLRGSDKCNTESECLKFPTYMNLLKKKWYENGFDKKYGSGNDVTANVFITSEMKTVMETALAFSSNTTYMSKMPFTPRWITNTNDVHPDNGTSKRPKIAKGKNADDIVLSSLSVLKMHMNAESTIGNCCSNWHQIIFHLTGSGCGLHIQNAGECIQHRPEPIFQACCEKKATPRCVRERLFQVRREFNDVMNATKTSEEFEERLWHEET